MKNMNLVVELISKFNPLLLVICILVWIIGFIDAYTLLDFLLRVNIFSLIITSILHISNIIFCIKSISFKMYLYYLSSIFFILVLMVIVTLAHGLNINTG